MAVDFLSDAVAARYGRFDGPPPVELEQLFFLDDADKQLIDRHRGSWSKLGFTLQLVTVRYLGCFLAADPLAVPTEVLDVVAAQLEIADPSCVKRYTERDKTHLDHAWEIQQAFDLHDFASAEVELTAKLYAHAWNTGDGPTAIFHYAVRWLRENDVLLPGITTLTRLVSRVREQATQRLFTALASYLWGNRLYNRRQAR